MMRPTTISLNRNAVNSSHLSLIKSDLPEKWQEILADLITDPKELLEILDLDPHTVPLGKVAIEDFPLKLPKPYAARIAKGNWQDPLLLQVWPDAKEEISDPSRDKDPLEESRFNPQPGLLHKYEGRVLLTAAPHCAIHCRYCFRRHFDYQANTPGRGKWREVIDYIAADDSIQEVILSGGDPLAAADSYLAWLLHELDAIHHVSTLRIHTRLPIVIPQRVTQSLLSLFSSLRCQVIIVTHCNHANEIDGEVEASLQKLRSKNHVILNQAVLLHDVNDDLDSLIALNKALFSQGVLPYYLHLPDRVQGTAHFDVSEAIGRKLIADMRKQLPGYLVPRLVREEPGESSKTVLA